MAVKKPDLVSYAQRAKPAQSSGAAEPSVKSSGGSTPKPDLVAYAKRVNAQKSAGPAQNAVTKQETAKKQTTSLPMDNVGTSTRPNSRMLSDVQTGGTTLPSLGEGRVKNTVTGAAKTAGAGYVNAGGMLAEGAGKLNTAISNANSTLQSDLDAVKSYQNMLRDMKWADGKAMTAADVKKVRGYLAAAERRVKAQQSYTSAVEASDKAVADKAYQKADELQVSGEADIAKAKEGLGTVGQFAVDLGVAGAQMTGDMAASAVIPGAGLAAMTVRSGGSSAQKARQAGAAYNQQLAYGIGSGALSLATEKISNVATPFKKAFGGGVLDKAISGAVAKMNGNAVGKLALSMLSEGGEEFIEDVFQPVLQRATYDPNARFDLSEALYDAAVGAAMGGIGGAVDIVRERSNTTTSPQEAAGAQTDVQEGSYAPMEQTRTEGAQNAASGAEAASKYDPIQAAAIRHEGKTFRNLVAGFDTTVTDFFQRWKNGRRNTSTEKLEKLYLGKISETARQQASNILGYDLSTRDMIVTNDDVKHIVSSHGKADAEVQRGNLPLAQWAIEAIPDVVTNPDTVSPGDIQAGGKHPGKRGLLFSKSLPNGTVVTVQFDNKGRNTMELTTMYVKKAAPTTQAFNVENTSSQLTAKPVPESMGSASVEGTRPLNVDSNIAQGAKNVKSDPLMDILFGKKRADMDTLTPEQQNAVYRANEAGTVGMDAAGKVFQIDPEEHIDRRSMASVGNKAVNAFQFDHPELHNYYQQAAADLITDADLSLQMPQSRRYERTAQGNTVVQQSQTSQALRTAMDETNLSRDAIIDAAQRIITDQGQENVAAAKRVELVLDEMLSNGYTTMDGRTVAPNERYLNAKRDIPGMVERSGEALPIFDTPGDAAAGAVNTGFDRMQARSEEFHPINENSARRVMNEQNVAPSEVPTVNPDTGNNITKTVSTILNSPLTSAEMKPIYESAIAGGKFDYTVQTDRDAVQRAQAHIARDGWQTVANTFIGKVDLGQAVSKVEMAEAISAYNTAVSEGNHQVAFELGTAISEAAHTSAQVTQAMNLMNRLTPEGKLLTLRKFVDKLNRKQQAKPNRKPAQTATKADIDNTRMNYVEDFTGFRISDELASNYLMAETDAERAAAWDAITTDIAGQLPSTFREKADFIRYTSMLTNPTTHIRNILGNAIQAGARTLKNGLGALIERAAIKDQSQRTKSVLVGEDAKALKDFARGQYETDQSAAMGAGKYSDASYRSIDREIMSKKKAFKGENLLSRGIQAVGDFNNAALDFEDVLFNRSAYVDSFAQALKAKGVTAEEAKAGTRSADVEAARAYAIEEARRATYRNTTALSEALSQLGRYEGDNWVKKIASFAADANLPFRRTPANILTTGLDYSPVGLVKAVTVDAAKVKNGTMSGADMVDHLSSGLTGTGIMALGAYLAAEGLLHVRAGDDDKEEAFEKASGKQDYALQIGDYSYSLDWAVPAAMPLFAGASIMESAAKDGISFDAVISAMSGMKEVVMETSMMTSLNELASTISYSGDWATYLIDRTAASYVGQFIPTVGSKIASAMDDTVRKSYVEKGTGQVSSDVNYFLQGAAKKVPGARNQLQPSIDLWGNEVSNGSAPARVFQSFLSPGYLKKADDSAATQEVRRLAEATGDSSVYPAAMDKSFTVDKKGKTLTAAEYTQYAKSAGSTRKKLIEEAVDLPAYKAMSNKEKAAYVQRVYDYARDTARKELAPGYETGAWAENAKNARRDIGVSTAEYLALYEKYGSSVMSGKGYEKVKKAVSAGLTVEEYMGAKDSADADGNGSVTKAEASAWIAQSGKRNKADLWDIICTTNAKNPYK